jgi:GntR family transcriptional repressor for pyruvate dehydrogenase complex
VVEERRDLAGIGNHGPVGHAVASRSLVQTPKAARQIADSLKQRILTGEFPPDSYLPPASSLIEEFGVSRLTLREALNVLEGEGLLRLRRGPNGGAIVQTPDSAVIIRQLGFLLRLEGTTIEQLMEVRLVVDPLAAAQAAVSADDADLDRIRSSLDRQQAQEALRDHEVWFTENLYFHWAIAAASHNPVVRILSESLHNITLEGGLKITFSRRERLESIKDHTEIYEGIANRDATAAAACIRRHLERSLYLRSRYVRGDRRQLNRNS